MSAALFAGFSTSAWFLCCSSAWRSCCGLSGAACAWGDEGGGVAPHMGTHKHASGCIRRLYRVSGLFGFARSVATHASRRHRKQGFSVFAQGGYMLFGIAWLPQYSIWWHSIRYTPHVHARGPDSFRAFLVTHVRGPTHTWPWYTEIDPKGITSFEQARLRPTHTHRYMQVKALEFDPLFMTVRADSSPHLNRAYANLFDFRPNFRPAGPKPKASYNIGYIYYIWVLRHSHIVSCVTLALTRREYSDVSLYTHVYARGAAVSLQCRYASHPCSQGSLPLYIAHLSPQPKDHDYFLAKTSCAHQRSRYTRAMYAYRRVRYAYMRRAHT